MVQYVPDKYISVNQSVLRYMIGGVIRRKCTEFFKIIFAVDAVGPVDSSDTKSST